MSYKETLIRDGFVIVPNFIDRDRALALFENYKQAEVINTKNDKQVPDSSYCIVNFKPFLELLCEKIPHVSEIVGEFVFPTYTYSRIYRNKNILKPHTDRPACEISLSVHLYGDQPWPMYMLKTDNTIASVDLNFGDAVVYLGCETPHWRRAYEGQEYGQVFLHYVLSTGKNWDEHFNLKHFAKMHGIQA